MVQAQVVVAVVVWMNKIALMGHSGKITIIHQQREAHKWTDHETVRVDCALRTFSD